RSADLFVRANGGQPRAYHGGRMSESPNGRRILVARVGGEAGQIIDAWRRQYDPQQALRLPPHATLCYWAPDQSQLLALERQIFHAFDDVPLSVRLGGVREFDNRERTFYVEVLDTRPLDRARQRLFDGSYIHFSGRRGWTWHVTCVRASRDRSDL